MYKLNKKKKIVFKKLINSNIIFIKKNYILVKSFFFSSSSSSMKIIKLSKKRILDLKFINKNGITKSKISRRMNFNIKNKKKYFKKNSKY